MDFTPQCSGLTSESLYSEITPGAAQGTTQDVRDETQISHMQGKLLTHYIIALDPDFSFFNKILFKHTYIYMLFMAAFL